MNDKELADAASKIIGYTPRKSFVGHHSIWRYKWGLPAEQFVRDWRVAGVLMEKVSWVVLRDIFDRVRFDSRYKKVEPRAIIEACLQQEKKS